MSKMPSHHFSLGFLAEDIQKRHMVLRLVGRSEPDTRLSLLVSAFTKPALLLCSHFDEDSDDAKRVGECPALRSKDILPCVDISLQFLWASAQMAHIVFVGRGVWLQGHILGSVRLFSIQLNSALLFEVYSVARSI